MNARTAAWPMALGWIDSRMSSGVELDRARVQRLARQLGYRIVWLPEMALPGVLGRAHCAEIQAVITPAPAHLDVFSLNQLMHLVDVETVEPRTSFSRWWSTEVSI